MLALGSPGGATIITTVLQILVDRIERGMPLTDAFDAPRVSQRNGRRRGRGRAGVPGLARGGAQLQARGEAFKLVPAPTIAPDSTGPRELGAATAIEFLGNGRMLVQAERARRGGGSAMVVQAIKGRR